MAFNFAAVQNSLQGAANAGVFGETVQGFAGVLGGNPHAVSSRPLLVQTSPQTVNPGAYPGAAVTDTSAPSAPFMGSLFGRGASPVTVGIILVATAALAIILMKK